LVLIILLVVMASPVLAANDHQENDHHAPPYGARDELPSGHVGSKAIQKFLDRVDLIVCGHIHEAKGLEKVGKTVVVNPGEASKGSCTLITIEEKENKPIEVEYIEV